MKNMNIHAGISKVCETAHEACLFTSLPQKRTLAFFMSLVLMTV